MFLYLSLSALLVGASLGLLGAGGAILTVPTLILLLGMEEKEAITTSLVIVTALAAIGWLKPQNTAKISVSTISKFALSSLPAASFGATIGANLENGIQTLLLVTILIFAGFKMLAPSPLASTNPPSTKVLITIGGLAGLITGLVGVGGGFIIVPALVIYGGLSLAQAVSSSLALITLNGLVAFTTLAINPITVNLNFSVIGIMVGVGALALIAGQALSQKLSQAKLKRSFAIVLILSAIALLLHLMFK